MRVEGDVAVGMAVQTRRAGDLDAAEPQRPTRSERVAVVPDPGSPGRARPAEQRSRPLEIGRDRHLEVGGIAGDDMDVDATRLEQGGLVGPRPVRGHGAGERVAQDPAADALRRLRRTRATTGRPSIRRDPRRCA